MPICEVTLSQGPNRGQRCKANVTPGNTKCSRHRRAEQKKAQKNLEKPQEPSIMNLMERSAAKAPQIQARIEAPPQEKVTQIEQAEPVQVSEEIENESDIEEPSLDTPEPTPEPPALLPPPEFQTMVPEGKREVFILNDGADESEDEPIREEEVSAPASEDGSYDTPPDRLPSRNAAEINQERRLQNEQEFNDHVELTVFLRQNPGALDENLLNSDVPIGLKLQAAKRIRDAEEDLDIVKFGLEVTCQFTEFVAASKGVDIVGMHEKVAFDKNVNKYLKKVSEKYADHDLDIAPEYLLLASIAGVGFAQYTENKSKRITYDSPQERRAARKTIKEESMKRNYPEKYDQPKDEAPPPLEPLSEENPEEEIIPFL